MSHQLRRRSLVSPAVSLIVLTAALLGLSPAPGGGAGAGKGDSLAARRAATGQAQRLGLGPQEELIVKSVVADPDGTLHTRYDRTLAGLPVIAGDLVVHEQPNGAISHVSRAHQGGLKVASTTPAVQKASARSQAAENVQVTEDTTDATLVVYAGGRQPRLAWDVVVTGVRANGVPSRTHVVIDAHSGTTLDQWDDVHTADDGTGHSIYVNQVAIGTAETTAGFELRDPDRGGSETHDYWTRSIFHDDDNVWGDGSQSDPASAGVDVHWGVARTWDYYLERHDRNGFDGEGTGITSTVHVGDNLSQAFWDGHSMGFGDGFDNQKPFVALDIVAHEFTHGVVQSTAGLRRGGLNEATADIFGTAVEWYAANQYDPPDYLIGEQIDVFGDGTPLRYLDRPSRGTGIDCWRDDIEAAGEHAAGGPAGHWYYLASEGSGPKVINGVSYDSPTCDGSSLTGIGREKVEQIWYRALTVYMTSTTTYVTARDDSIRAAIDLFGGDSAECAGVEDAWDAVSVPSESVRCTDQGGDFLRAPASRHSTVETDRRRAACTSPAGQRCDPRSSTITGTLDQSGAVEYLPRPGGYFSTKGGTLGATLDGPEGTDFDLRLQKYDGWTWFTVAASLSDGSTEKISYDASPGYYSWVVESFSGSGPYTLSID